MSSITTARCATCRRESNVGETFQRCSGCKKQNYCSADCQRSDWKRGHKQKCKTVNLDKSALATATTHVGDSVQGIRLACAKEPGSIDKADIPNNHPIFDGPLLEVPAIMGIPLVICRVGTQSNHHPDLDCQIATYLNIAYHDGLAPLEWQSHIGSCLVARKDKKPLSVEHIEAVWMYIDRLMDLFGDDSPRRAQKDISREGFERWFKGYKKKNVQNGRPEWGDVGSLYEL
jgi:hypothetical protein